MNTYNDLLVARLGTQQFQTFFLFHITLNQTYLPTRVMLVRQRIYLISALALIRGE